MSDPNPSDNQNQRGPLSAAELSHVLGQARRYLEVTKKFDAAAIEAILAATKASLINGEFEKDALRQSLEKQLPKSEASRIVRALVA